MITFYLVLFGLMGTSILAFFSSLFGWLSKSGAWAMAILGTAIFALSPAMALYLFLFFGSSYLLQAIKKHGASPLASDKDGPRDAWQVLSNCGPLLIFLLLEVLSEDPRFVLCQISVIAAACADTCSSEIGVLSRRPPRLLFSFKVAPAGLSGAISLVGLLAGALGSALIAFTWWLPHFLFLPQTKIVTGLLVWLLGFIGTVLDSMLGATFQVKYRDATGALTDKKKEKNLQNSYVAGIPHFTNDGVNFATGLLTGALAFFLQTFLSVK
ncbi:DUF92 domain-containing protein [Enterococcus sp. 2201sp1_2201st1_B8_2201SCRN_220225]|uniref:DUF92 domain-containing protein n=1 Tax=unclassified Enterococcus TaxID=2608891 RepID=UPI0034A524E2